MSGMTIDPRLAPTRGAPRKPLTLSWADPRIRNIFWQGLVIGSVVLIIWYFAANAARNMAERHIASGFGFLGLNAPIPIGESLIEYIPSVSTYGRALLVGILNTLKVAVVGCVVATIWGTLLGVGRLSKNWLVAKLTAIYVETLRDIPLLLQLFFWYGLMQALPALRQALNPLPGIFLSQRGIKLPALDWEFAHNMALCAFAIGAGVTYFFAKFADGRQAKTGIRPKVWPVALALMVGLPFVVWLVLGAPFHLDVPVLRGFNFQGGLTITPEYAALLIGLVVYTASYIAEIVRSGIESVALGQWEAGGALGLRNSLVLRQIVLPQALRVIIPPMTSQYLNLIKNSSLAIAIGYQDIVSVAYTTLNQTGQSIEGVGIIMAVYLTISLSISLFMNWYNKRIRLVER
jgi:general L-amino acid transport system permease protein